MGKNKEPTVFPTLITTNTNGEKIKSSTTEEKIKTFENHFKNIFSEETNKSYFDNKHK